MTQSELAHIAGAIDGSTINIVMCISITIINWQLIVDMSVPFGPNFKRCI